MNGQSSDKIKLLSGFCVVFLAMSITFGALWQFERNRAPIEKVREIEKPDQVIKEVPVEKIKEVIKEVEVPAKLSIDELVALDMGKTFFAAKEVEADGVLKKLESVAFHIFVDDAVKKAVSEERVKNKFELILRRHNVPLDGKDSELLFLNLDGFWDKEETRLTFSRSLELTEHVYFWRNKELRILNLGTTWRETTYGYAGKAVAEKAILDSVEAMAESFANKFLANRDKESTTDGSK